MEIKEAVKIARIALNKKMTYEKLKYSDYMYEKEDDAHIVYDFVVEAETMGMKWFNDRYSKYF